MKRILPVSLLLIFVFSGTYAQEGLWSITSPERASSLVKLDRASTATAYDLYTLDMPMLKNRLQIKSKTLLVMKCCFFFLLLN